MSIELHPKRATAEDFAMFAATMSPISVRLVCGKVNLAVAEVRQEEYTLPQGFHWDTLHLDDPLVLKELYVLLNENYVEDDDNMFR